MFLRKVSKGFRKREEEKMLFAKKDDFLSRGKTVQALCSSLRISSAASALATLAEKTHHEDQEISRQGSEKLKPERPLRTAFICLFIDINISFSFSTSKEQLIMVSNPSRGSTWICTISSEQFRAKEKNKSRISKESTSKESVAFNLWSLSRWNSFFSSWVDLMTRIKQRSDCSLTFLFLKRHRDLRSRFEMPTTKSEVRQRF